MKEVHGGSPRGAAPGFRHFLDTVQYTDAGIQRYEAIYGDGYISCGGRAVTQQLAPYLELQVRRSCPYCFEVL